MEEDVRKLMKAGDVKGAAEKLRAILSAEPDNAEAKILYGTCCHLLGDDKTFTEIHDALTVKMTQGGSEGGRSLWQRYHNLWVGAVAGSLSIATGVWVGVEAYDGLKPKNKMHIAGDEMVGQTLYGGPGYDKRLRVQTNVWARSSCVTDSVNAAEGRLPSAKDDDTSDVSGERP